MVPAPRRTRIFNASDGVSRAIHTINLQADASSHGVGAASARAVGTVGGNAVAIGGDVTLAAEADNLAGNGALAVGLLDLANVANVQVLGDISILAHGTNLGGGLVNAQGNADFTGVNTLRLHDVTIDAVALNKGNGAGAKANAMFNAERWHQPLDAQPRSAGRRQQQWRRRRGRPCLRIDRGEGACRFRAM